MSIYGSWAAPDDEEHEDECGGWHKEDNVWRFDGPCDCGQPDAPLVYQGSHVLPSEDDKRGGNIDIATIGVHVRFWRDHPDAPVSSEPEGYEPFIRFGVNESTVVLTRRNVEQVAASLNEWLELTA